jgi:enoyl-CoA hydratase
MLVRARGLLSLGRRCVPRRHPSLAIMSSSNTANNTVVLSRHPEVLIERPLSTSAVPAPSVERPSDDGTTDDGVRILRLNAPDALNCLSDDMTRGFASAIEELKADRLLRAVVITGEGRGFCAGGSFSFIRDRLESGDPAGNARALEALYGTFLALRTLPVPVIAAVNGPAVGGGAGIALACDVALIATSAKIGFNFVSLGITPGMAASYLLPQATSHAAACRLLLTGEVIGADEAVKLGLALEQHAPDELLPAALKLARKMAAGCPRAVRETLALLRSRGGGYEAVLEAAKQEAARQGFYFTRGEPADRSWATFLDLGDGAAFAACGLRFQGTQAIIKTIGAPSAPSSPSPGTWSPSARSAGAPRPSPSCL